jgi:AraC-like DNA-binding protein
MHAVASSPVPQIRFDSSSLPAGTALDRWRSNLSQSWDMSLVDEAAAPHFHADVSMWRMDGLLVGTADFGPTQTRMRREKNIRADQLDHYRVLLMRAGEFHCDADGTQVSLSPGQFVVTDMALPESSESACASAVAYVPREMLENALPRSVPLHGASPRNACAGLLGEHLSALLLGLPSATPEELPFLTQATVNLIAASLASSAENQALARPAIDNVLLRRARKYVEQHLTQDELSASQLCLHLKLSRSTLYRLFEPLGGVAQYIKERRLARVHEILSQSSERPHIARLAESHGFKSAAHFSKAFREQFGYSAREVRFGGACRVGHHRTAARFEEWLGSLQ